MIRPGRFGGPVGRNAMEDCACRGKNLDKMLQPAILSCVFTKDSYGPVILEELAESPLFRGEAPDKAGVYRTLKRMVEEGHLTAEWEANDVDAKPRRRYAITDSGKNCLAYWMQTLKYYEQSVHFLAKKIEKLFCP